MGMLDGDSDSDSMHESGFDSHDILEVIELGGNEDQAYDDEDGDDMQEDEQGDQPDDQAGQDPAAPRHRPQLESDASVGFDGHSDSVFCVRFSPVDRNIVASGGGDDKAFIWSSETGEVLHELVGHTDSVNHISFNNDGKYIATGGMDGIVRVWETATGALVCSCEGPDEIQWTAWHPKGNVLLAGGSDGLCWMWNIPSAKVMQVFSGHSGPLTTGGFLPDGKHIYTAGEDSQLTVWDPKTGEPVTKMSSHIDGRFHQEGINCAAVHTDSTLIVTGGSDGTAKAVHAWSGKLLHSLEAHTDSVEDVAFCPTMPYLATASLDGFLCLWDSGSMQLRQKCDHNGVGITKIRWHPTQPTLVTCCLDGTVHVWDGRTGAELQQLHGHEDGVLDVDISADGVLLASASDDHSSLIFTL